MFRRQFIQRAFFGFWALLFSGRCGRSEQTAVRISDEPGSCEANGTLAEVGTNHGHKITVTAGEITAAAEKSYQIQGDSEHNHSVIFSAAQFQSLQQGQSVTSTTSVEANDGHRHLVTISCLAGDSLSPAEH